ncbi:MAG TPA: type II toxin-antitoxin system RelE/ParE family toxin [Bacteroidia bacterium]|jgi:toxin YoeB|nr:type II toxin-antitoxin system RelE/ParE family toxin [Bacteroidia bacterium]
MAKTLRWTKRAKAELIAILEFWTEHNQSPSYSNELAQKIDDCLALICDNSSIGKKTDDPAIRITYVDHFLIYYEILKHDILIITIFDGRRNPFDLKLK